MSRTEQPSGVRRGGRQCYIRLLSVTGMLTTHREFSVCVCVCAVLTRYAPFRGVRIVCRRRRRRRHVGRSLNESNQLLETRRPPGRSYHVCTRARPDSCCCCCWRQIMLSRFVNRHGQSFSSSQSTPCSQLLVTVDDSYRLAAINWTMMIFVLPG